MFKDIFLFEISFRLKRISTYVYFGIWFLMGFIYMSSDSVLQLGIGTKVAKNSPYGISQLLALLTAFGTPIISAVTGTAIYRDFEERMHLILFSTPISKFGYLGGRLFGSLFSTFIIFIGIPIGMFLGTLMPWADSTKLAPFSLMSYLQPFLLIVIPNILFLGTLFFLVGTLTRNILAVYLQGVVVFAIYLISLNLIGDVNNQFTPALLDPFGLITIDSITKYWTVADRNNLLLPISGVMLYNRLLWSLLAIIAAATVYRLFSFSAEAISVRKTKKKKVEELEESINRFHLSLPVVLQQFDGRTELQQFLILTKTRFFGIIKEATFIAIVLIGSALLVSNAIQAGSLYDTPTYPVTRAVMEIVADSFTLFFIIITTLYSGELVWKEKGINFDQIYDALPLPGYVTYLSRLLALMLVHISLIFGLIVVGVLTQIYYGYYKFELGLALRYQFGVTFPFLLQLSILTLLIQTLIRNKFLGHTVVILYYIAQIAIVQFGYEHKLYIFASRASLIYSDINGFGHFVKPMVAFSFYWTAFAGLLALVSLLYQVRGTDLDLKSRTKQAINNFTRPLQIVASTFALAFLSLGGYIFYNTNVLNQYVDSNQRRKLSAEFEKTYKKYEKLPQPKVTKVKLAVDIFPELRGMKAKGSYELKNKTSAEIDHIHIVQNRDMEEIFNFNREVKKELEDKKLNYTIYKLASPLKPGETCNLDFELSYSAKGFKNSDEDNSFAANGTFFNDSYFPTIGYNPNLELNDDDDRKKEGLNPKPTLPPVDDPEARMFSGLAHDADWITFDATVSTSPDQVAIAPGYLQKEWIENGRRYFEYSMEQTKILNFYSFLSGRFEVKRDKWKDVNIEVYYHKEHSYNLDRMINSVKKSLDYFTTNFGPYQHKQFRIIEFPRYDSFAQSFPNTVPYSEAIGFIARIDKEEDIDFPFYVTAHEMAHQWWGHQVVGGRVQGTALLLETFSQYSALMVMEKEYGKENMRKFLKHELDRYLRGRAFERKKEQPLFKVEDQSYIYYQKGSLVMYALKDYIGEEAVNRALSNFLKAVAYQEPPYTNSIEFLKYLKEETPSEFQYLITDMFETITLFENRALEATATKRDNGKYLVKLKVSTKKFRAEGSGEEKEIAVNDHIDIGIFSGKEKEEKVLHLQKYKITEPEMNFEIEVDSLPLRAGIDPYNKLIDRNSDDNIIKVE